MSIPITFYVMVGVVAAALLTGLFNFTNTVISKEKEISDYRQEWLDNFRIELSLLLGQIDTLLRLAENELPEGRKGFKGEELNNFRNSNKEHFEKLNEVYYRIKLRLNKEEHKIHLEVLTNLYNMFYGPCDNLHAIQEYLNNVCSVGQSVTKSVWEEVKSGEPIFRRLRIWLFVGILVALMALALTTYKVFETASNKAPQPTAEGGG